MLTRKMTEHLTEKINELERLINEQSLQLQRLQNVPQGPAPAAPQNNFDQTKIPDIIKMIPVYTGVENELPAWIDSVERKLECAKKMIPQDRLPLVVPIWETIIRDKVTGIANETLLRSNTDCCWEAIKTKLKDRFGDKRDLSTILSKIPYLRQGSLSINDFYHHCDSLLSDIRAKVMLDENLKICATSIMDTYETMIINAFVDGLYDPISALTRTSRPTSLHSAYQHALDQDNAAKRQKDRLKVNTRSNPINQRVTQFQPDTRRNPQAMARPQFMANTSYNQQPQQLMANSSYNQQPQPSGERTVPFSKPFNQNSQPGTRFPPIKQEKTSSTNYRQTRPNFYPKNPQINMHGEYLDQPQEELPEEETDDPYAEEEQNFPPDLEHQETD